MAPRVPSKFQEEEKQELSALQSNSSKTRPQTSGFTSSINTKSKKRKFDDVDDPRLSNYNRSFMAHVEDEAEEEDDDIRQVNARQLERHMKSKKQLYACLTLEGNLLFLLIHNLSCTFIGQIFLPPPNDCTVAFMQQIMCGQKKVSALLGFLFRIQYLTNSQIKVVKVPHLAELSASRIY